MKYRIEFEHRNKDFEDVWNIEQSYLEPATIAPVNQTIEWNKKNLDIHIFVRDIEADKIVGEVTILPLSKNQFEKFMINKLEDTEINKDTLLNYEDGKQYYLLFSAIAIDKDYRDDRSILSYLLQGVYEKIKELRKREITFLNMCAEGQTVEGQKCIETLLNLKHKYTTKDGYKLYSFNSTEECTQWLARFIMKYDKKYKNGNSKQ